MSAGSMRIGVDFDNTIANYDGVFHAAALERGLIPKEIGSDKNAVRDYLNGLGRKDDFTELQGYVYGQRMALASVYTGFEDFVANALIGGHDLFVVSHKTRHPLMGPGYDLHEAAREFLSARQIMGINAIPSQNVYFEVTKVNKVARVRELGIEVFVDDLPEILAMEGFPNRTRKILFDPSRTHVPAEGVKAVSGWGEIWVHLTGLRE